VLKGAILAKIEREIEKSTKQKPGHIVFKANALEDKDVVKALYAAARAGVQVDLIIRDTCRIRAGIPGLSEGVRVISIVGRFLEHSRIYYFQNGGEEEFFIGSADLMQRNLESRVESVVPVEQPALRAGLRFILETQIHDQRSAWEMLPDGSYVQRRPGKGAETMSSQEIFMATVEKRYKESTRLKRRKPKGLKRRNVDR
jgi:polyphosphate kinase